MQIHSGVIQETTGQLCANITVISDNEEEYPEFFHVVFLLQAKNGNETSDLLYHFAPVTISGENIIYACCLLYH